jgi:uncharacterized protein YjiS (DUF1127 family)
MSVHPHQSLRDLNILVTPAAPAPSLRQKIRMTFGLWQQRTRTRRFLAQVDARSLSEAGISPAAAAFEAGRPFWRPMGSLR